MLLQRFFLVSYINYTLIETSWWRSLQWRKHLRNPFCSVFSNLLSSPVDAIGGCWFFGLFDACLLLIVVALCTNSINFVPTLKPLRSGPCNVRTRVAKSSKLTRFAFYNFPAAKLIDFGCISSTSCLAQKGTFLMGSSYQKDKGTFGNTHLFEN